MNIPSCWRQKLNRARCEFAGYGVPEGSAPMWDECRGGRRLVRRFPVVKCRRRTLRFRRVLACATFSKWLVGAERIGELLW